MAVAAAERNSRRFIRVSSGRLGGIVPRERERGKARLPTEPLQAAFASIVTREPLAPVATCASIFFASGVPIRSESQTHRTPHESSPGRRDRGSSLLRSAPAARVVRPTASFARPPASPLRRPSRGRANSWAASSRRAYFGWSSRAIKLAVSFQAGTGRNRSRSSLVAWCG